MASLVHAGRELSGEADRRLLFPHPAVGALPGRRRTIRSSGDGGRTWSEGRWLPVDEGASAGNVCPATIDDSTVGILYEGSRAHMGFER
ncbi:MAG: hypothetical protein ACPGPE_12690, partial [Planctomycetota bacterium]